MAKKSIGDHSIGAHAAPSSKKKSGGLFSGKKASGGERFSHAASPKSQNRSGSQSHYHQTPPPVKRQGSHAETDNYNRPVMRQTPSQRQQQVPYEAPNQVPPRAVLGTKESPRKSFTQEFVPTDVIDYVESTRNPNAAEHPYYKRQNEEAAQRVRRGNQQSTNSSSKNTKRGKPQKQKKQKKKSNAVYNVLIALCVLIFVGAAGVLVYQFMDYNEAKQVRNKLEDMVVEPTEPVEEGTVKPLVDYSKLVAENPDFVGWVQIPNTKINYPVVKSTDNDKYLYNNFYGEHHKLGTVFIDYRDSTTAEKTSDNLVLYGHSAADGSYFAAVRDYKELDYFKAHPVVSFNTTYESADWVIVGAFMADALDTSDKAFLYHNYIDFKDENEFATFTTEMASRSYYTSPADTQFGDKFITLSTCDYDFDESRFAIVARKLRPGEKVSDFDFDATLENKNKIMPDRWYA